MKKQKILLAGTALFGLALTSAPAAAELSLDLGGHFRGYGVYNNSDVADTQDLEIRRDTKVHFTGEATSDNGLTVGVYTEASVGGALLTEEAYAYFSNSWGRINLGSEDGAAYLLQVAAPAADSNVDGLRTTIQSANQSLLGTITTTLDDTGYTGSLTDAFSTDAHTDTRLLDYDHADFRDTDRLTYLSPKLSGFQAGVSYAPQAGQKLIGSNVAPAGADNDDNQYKDLIEIAARWDGEVEGFGISAGAGYSTASLENDPPVAALPSMSDDMDTWNVGLNVAYRGFSLGGAYLNTATQTDVDGSGATAPSDIDADTWVVGAAWDNGPYHVGASYFDQKVKNTGAAQTIDADRWTIGAGYTYGPGMSLRASLAQSNLTDGTAVNDQDFTQVAIGTDIHF